MKRLLLAALIGTATLVSFSSCKKEYITQEISMYPGSSYFFEKNSNAWTKVGNENLWRLDLPINGLSQDLKDYGDVSVAISFNANNPGAYQAIPAQIFGHNYSFEYSVQKVTIYAEGLTSNATAPGDMAVKIVITNAEEGN
ncbi:hypothetical protein [Sphingobacterium thalpophilum]|uniref:hypothetical protein n=1 Tax=Sphingobacterium thalpophilum TaxID=259 RepID=UPI003C78058C